MRKILIYVFVIILSSCSNKDGMKSDKFRDVAGILYYEKPETGSLVNIVFVPFAQNNNVINFKRLSSIDFEYGIKFGTANNLIKDRLYSLKRQKLIIKDGLYRTVYLIPKVKIYFHTERSALIGNDVLEKDINVDTLVQKNNYLLLKYRYGGIVLDSITAKI